MNKYRAKKVSLDGHVFDSKAEARRYGELRLMQKSDDIADLRIHPIFPLVVNGTKISSYVADFRYYDSYKNCWVVEDVKSPVTAKLPAFIMKKKLMLALYGIEVKEVRA